MKRKKNCQSGLFNFRVLTAFALCSVGVLLALFAQADTQRSRNRKVKSQQRTVVFAGPTNPNAPTTTITVNNTSPVIANDGFCTLPEAIIAANTRTASGTMAGECPAGSSGGNIIVLQTSATYTLLVPHNASYGPNGLPGIISPIAILGNGAIIENAGTTNFRLLYISPAGSLSLQNLTLRKGVANGGNGGAGIGGGGGLGGGGAIYNQGGLTLNGVTVTNNTASGGNGGNGVAGQGAGGAGMGADGGDSTGGTPGGGGGGGMGGKGGEAPTTGGGGGGGANIGEPGNPGVGPTGGPGGGTTGGNGGNGAPLVATNGGDARGFGGGGGGAGNGAAGLKSGNGAVGGGSGGCVNAACVAGAGGFGGGGGSGGNGTGGNGGFGGGGGSAGGAAPKPGLGGFGGGKGAFDGGGGAGMGGAIFNDAGVVTLVNSTLTGNMAAGGSNGTGISAAVAGDGLGGAIFNLNGSVTVNFSTLVNNKVTGGVKGPGGLGTVGQARGGAVYNHSEGGAASLSVQNSIIANSIGAADCNNDGGATLTSSGYNLVKTPGATCSFAAAGDLIGADPLLNSLADNGGPTNTHATQPGSQGIDRIPNGINGCQSGTSVDQRGAPRAGGPGKGGNACDSGAYEFNSTIGPVPTASPPPGTPRFFNYQSPPGVGDSAGEPSIGSNWTKETISHNHNVNGSPDNNIPNGGTSLYFGGFLPSMVKLTWDECSSPAGTLWENKPLLGANTPRAFGDPILFTDHDTGRTFACQLEGLTPAGSTIDITDDDGDNFIPSDGVIPSDVDHETIGGGRNHSPLPNPGPVYQNAIYYASQSVGEARAFRSDNGGLLFSQAATPMYAINDCSGLHGHIKVSPADGTVYVPNRGCGGAVPFHETGAKQTLLVSEDNGITWTQRPIPDSTTHGNGDADNIVQGTHDPSVGVATDGTVYFGYQGADGHPRIAVSHDKGQNWLPSVDIGAVVVNGGPVLNSAFPAVVAGDPSRAAFAFFGTETSGDNWACGQGDDCTGNVPGSHPKPHFTGVWYLYVATTFDGGATWTTQNITPGDPIQRGGICGGSTCRNLLDFFDATIDKQGRIVIGYDDGCITATCIIGDPSITEGGGKNDYTSKAVVARQSGGKRMFSAFDPPVPALPGAPILTARLNDVAASATSATLSWSAPDDGGAAITGYKIYRKTGATGIFNLIATTPVTNYTDGTLSPGNTYMYHVTAANVVGEGPYCSDVAPIFVPNPVTPPACVVPGVLTNNDLNANGSDNDSGANTPPDPRVNIRQLFVAEPCFGPGVNKLVFTMQLAPSTAGSAPPSSQWYIIWQRQNPDANFDRWYVAMKSDPNGVVSFEYGKFGVPLDATNPNPNANTPSRLGDADTGTYDVATGLVRITLSNSKAENVGVGGSLSRLNVRTYLARPDAGQKSQNNASDITPDGNYILQGNGACCGPVPLLGVVSRKTHTGIGPFDVALPLSPNPIGIECRNGGANGDHKIVFTFANPLANVASASITSGSGSIASSSIQNIFEYVVNLTGVTNAQRLTVTLTSVRDTAGDRTDTLPVTIGVLLGDVDASGRVDSTDVFQVRQQSLQNASPSNFRTDVDESGRIDSTDVFITRQQTLTSLP
ncbi:MAG TPA: choice-of-anchor Q domain-containing protein [Chthoniobacterales bacterium]|nr:choice-of-anchor Q domain-containing protein [Chthoniobacterales bacterium]